MIKGLYIAQPYVAFWRLPFFWRLPYIYIYIQNNTLITICPRATYLPYAFRSDSNRIYSKYKQHRVPARFYSSVCGRRAFDSDVMPSRFREPSKGERRSWTAVALSRPLYLASTVEPSTVVVVAAVLVVVAGEDNTTSIFFIVQGLASLRGTTSGDFNCRMRRFQGLVCARSLEPSTTGGDTARVYKRRGQQGAFCEFETDNHC